VTMETPEKLLDKIRKLHAKAESLNNLGNKEEAALFASKVQELLTQHKLEMDVLEFEEMEQDEPIGDELIETSPTGHKKARIAWREQLVNSVAQAHYCRILVYPGSSKVVLVGRPTDRAVATYMIQTLVGLAEVLADAAYVKHFYEMKALGNVRKARGYRPAFLVGFVNTIRKRYHDEAEALKTKAEGTGLSLVRLDQEREKVKQYADTLSSGKATHVSTKVYNKTGLQDGEAAGHKVRIRGTGLHGGKQTTRDRLAQGQRLLGGGA